MCQAKSTTFFYITSKLFTLIVLLLFASTVRKNQIDMKKAPKRGMAKMVVENFQYDRDPDDNDLMKMLYVKPGQVQELLR